MHGPSGAREIVADIPEAQAKETAAGITSADGEAIFTRLDVTSEAGWNAAMAEATKCFGGLDNLVDNAGIYLGRDFMEVGLEEWSMAT